MGNSRFDEPIRTTTIGWQPSCDCPEHEPTASLVLDPFCGTGTTGLVARQLGRSFVGLDLSYTYLHDQAAERLFQARSMEKWNNGHGKAAQALELGDDLPMLKMLHSSG